MARPDPALDALAGVELFRGLERKDLKRIAAMSKEQAFVAGTAITEEGKKGARFYVLLDGQADVRVGDDLVHALKPGDYFGEISLIDGEPRSATVVAQSEVRALTLSSWNFRPLLREHPQIAEAIILEMCRRLRDAQKSPLH